MAHPMVPEHFDIDAEAAFGIARWKMRRAPLPQMEDVDRWQAAGWVTNVFAQRTEGAARRPTLGVPAIHDGRLADLVADTPDVGEWLIGLEGQDFQPWKQPYAFTKLVTKDDVEPQQTGVLRVRRLGLLVGTTPTPGGVEAYRPIVTWDHRIWTAEPV